MIDDVYDYFVGEGIYCTPTWDGHHHHVGGKSFTTTALCEEVKRILGMASLRIYLDCYEDVIVRYFIQWYTIEIKDVPYRVWVDDTNEDGSMTRHFHYERFSGVVEKFVVGSWSKPPESVYKDLQTAIKVEESLKEDMLIPVDSCQMGSCSLKARHKHAVKDTYLYVCDEHFSVIQEQISNAEKRKKTRPNKNHVRKKKMSAEEARALIKQMS